MVEMGEYFGFGFETESKAGFGLGFVAESKAGFGFGFDPKPCWKRQNPETSHIFKKSLKIVKFNFMISAFFIQFKYFTLKIEDFFWQPHNELLGCPSSWNEAKISDLTLK